MAVPLSMLWFAAEQLLAAMNSLLTLLLDQGVLDEQFLQLQHLEDESDPTFVADLFNLYFRETEKFLPLLRGFLSVKEEPEFEKVVEFVHQMMGSSSGVGARRIRDLCCAFRGAAVHRNRPECLVSLTKVEQEYCYLKNKLLEFFQMDQQRALMNRVRYPPHN